MNNEMLRKSISYLFAFFIAFFLFVMVLMSSVRFTILDQGYFMNRMNEVKYYNNTATELNRIIKQNARAAGFEVSTFEDFLKEEDIREDMINYEQQKLAGEDAIISIETFKERLETKIRSYSSENQIVVTDNVQAALDQFVNSCVEKYSYLTQFPYLDVYGDLMLLYQKVYLIAIPVLFSLTLGLAFFLSRLHRSWRRKRRYYAYGIVGAGFLISVAPMLLYAMRFFEKINLEPQYMYQLLVSMTRNLLMSNIIIGFILILIGIVIAYSKPMKQRSKKKEQRNRKYSSTELISQIEKE